LNDDSNYYKIMEDIVEIRRKFDVWYYYPWQMDTDKIRKSTV